MRASEFLTAHGWAEDKLPETREKLCAYMEGFVRAAVPNVLKHVSKEVARQEEKWGVQNHPDFHPAIANSTAHYDRPAFYGLPTEQQSKALCDADASKGETNWMRILTEEVSETAAAPDEETLRKELVQVSAVAVSWIDAIDRRKAMPQAPPTA